MVRPIVHSTKHYVQFPISVIATGLRETNLVVSSVDVADKNLVSEVEEGNTVKAVYFELWLQNQGNLGEFIMTITKDPEAGTGPNFAEMASLSTWTNKKNVLYTTQGLTSNDGVSGPVNVIRNWIKIPKSKQRFGLGDRINMNISNVSGNDLNRCGFTTYKEYS